MTEQDKRNIKVAQLLYSGEEDEVANIAQDILWHVPGHNPVSGDYRGFIEYTQIMPARMAPLSRWEFTLEDVMVNGDLVVTTWRLQGERKGKVIDTHGAHVLLINDQGKVVEGWGFTNEQDALDIFFSD